jgi:CrcB protein
MWFAYFCVAVGGALGSLGRFWLSGLVAERYGSVFPWGTLVINVTGSFIIGVFQALNESEGRVMAAPAFRQFFMIGICGGYTTFSSFSLETLKRAQDGQWLYAGGNVVLSVVFCLVAVWLGYAVGGIINSMKGH